MRIREITDQNPRGEYLCIVECEHCCHEEPANTRLTDHTLALSCVGVALNMICCKCGRREPVWMPEEKSVWPKVLQVIGLLAGVMLAGSALLAIVLASLWK